MDNRKSLFEIRQAIIACCVAWAVLTTASAENTPGGHRPPTGGAEVESLTLPLYEPAESLQATLLATRRQYSAWCAGQPAARRAVELEPWWATSPLSTAEIGQHVRPEEGIDLAAKLPDGRALWTRREQLVEGRAVKLGGGSAETSVFLARTVRAESSVRLTVGMGGGDRLDLWLNGQQLVSADTCLTSGRYGCSYRYDGTRTDQVLVDLNLIAGDNTLSVRLHGGEEPSCYFTATPQPVPRIWERIRRDFPLPENPLLELAHADWFGQNGWFAAPGSEWEEQFILRSADDCGPEREAIRAELQRLKHENAPRDDGRWLDLCVKTSVLAKLQTDLVRLRDAVQELGRTNGDEYPSQSLLGRLDDYQRRLSQQAVTQLDPADAATRRLMAELPRMQREMLVQLNPLLKDHPILFVKRTTYNSKHYYDDFLHISRFGGNLCVLSLDDGHVRELAPQLAGGIFDRYDLSFDGAKVIFGYRRPRPEGFRLYEIGVDGGGLRQVTFPPADEERRITRYGQTSAGENWYGALAYQFWTDDMHPCFLPDGGICFASTRCEHGVLCTPGHYLACTNLFRLDADGGDLRPLSHGALSEYTPTMMDDGRILYNRWEYVYKGIAAVQPLWVMRPDGSGSEEFYGDNITNPGVLWQARQVPGHPRLAVCIGCGHEPLGVGQVLLLNVHKNKRTVEPMTSLTPNVKTENLRGLYQLRNGEWREDIFGPFFADPYPLSDKFFLVSCNLDKRYNDPSAYGLYLLDTFGNLVPIYDDPEISCWQPMPLKPRKRPPALPEVGGDPFVTNPRVAPSEENAKATVFLSDVYQGLDGVRRGMVKYIRVMEQIAKPWAAEVDELRGESRLADGFGGHIAVSHNAHIWIAVLLGIVPVEKDGSACFEVPADRNLFFQALDEDFMEVQRMRTFINFRPGETRSCIGCHEHRTQAPVSRLATACGRRPRALGPQPGEVAPRPLHYPSDVQPMLDQHCVRCHNGRDPQTQPDLRGELTTIFNRSYENIMKAGLVNTIREWAGATYSMQHAEAAAPYSYGSHRSKFVELLKAGHYDVQLSQEEWIKLVTWIDCGAPYYGSYFGRRNLAYRGQPDFRPVPTIESACGIPPVVGLNAPGR